MSKLNPKLITFKHGFMRRAVSLVAVSLVGCGIFGSVSAQAASPGSADMWGTCDYRYHTMTARATFEYDLNRYPHGTHLHLRFAYARANGGGTRIAGWQYIGWINKGWVQPNVQDHYDAVTGWWREINPNNLGSYRLPPKWGYWIAKAQVAAWNGADWDYSNWGGPDAYGILDAGGPTYGYGPTPSCAVSLS